MRALVTTLLRADKIWFHAVAARTKTVQSLGGKLRRKAGKYKTLAEITDLVGVRVITYLPRDVDTVARTLRRSFVVDEANSVDRRQPERASEFGYGSLHLVLSLPKKRLSLPEYRPFTGIKFEVQIRTILQHTWAEMEHDIGYKATTPLEGSAQRNLFRVAALLEQADATLDSIFATVASSKDIHAASDHELTDDVLANMLDHDPEVLRLEALLDEISTAGVDPRQPAAVDMRLAELKGHGIDTSAKLRASISQHYEQFRRFLPAAIGDEDADGGQWSRGASLSLYCEYLAACSLDLKKTVAYLVKEKFYDDGEFVRDYSRRLIAAVKSARRLS